MVQDPADGNHGKFLLTFASDVSADGGGGPTPSDLSVGELAEDPQLEVRLSYGDFANTFGGAWFDRLTVIAYPSCFATSPALPECATGVPLALANDSQARELTFTTVDDATVFASQDLGDEPRVSVESDETDGFASGRAGVGGSLVDPAAGGVVYAVGGEGGNFGASPLSITSSWQVGTGSGEFTYAYPLELPRSLGGSTPDLALDYSSGSVDGMSLSENGQAGMAGIGWDLSTSYITRQYALCADEGHPDKGDLCWNSLDGQIVDDLSIVLNGRASRLVRINSTNEFRLTDDPGWKVEKLQEGHPSNSDNNDEAFRVTTPDGTKYWFGYGGGSGSVWTVPVFATEAGQQCHHATISQSRCQQGWQWNLDKVVDTHGNVTSYTYADETNHYALWGNTTTPVEYDRAGRLTKIEYGYRNVDTVAHQVVQVASGKRCTKSLSTPGDACTGADSPQNNPSLWPDVPTDLICDSSSSCMIGSPSFFSIHRYAQVTTETVQEGSGDLTTRKVDVYTLTHTMSDPDGNGPDQPDLWLTQVDRTGHGANGEPLAMTPFSIFSSGTPLQNRVVATGNDRTLKKFRVGAIRNEQGGRIDIVYGHAQGGGRACDPTYVTGRERWTSTRECFPQRYAPPGGSARWERFHKYVVTRIALSDIALGFKYLDPTSKATDLGQLRIYDYDYWGVPAWRYVRDNNVANEDETWDDWRGYETTVVHTRKTPKDDYSGGSTTDVAVTRTTVFRGMNNSRINPDGDVRSNVRLDTDEWGSSANEPLDQPWLQGMVAESRLDGPSGNMINRTYREYRNYNTASDAMGPDGHIVWEHLTRTRTKDASGGPDLVHEVTTQTDPGGEFHLGLHAGTVISSSSIGYHDVGEPGHQSEAKAPTSCTTISWNGNSDLWLRVPKTTTTYSIDCPRLPASSGERDVVTLAKSDACYDSEDVNVAGCPGLPTVGNLTGVRTYAKAGSNPIKTSTAYDHFGRVTGQTNGRGYTTHYAYNGAGTSSTNDLLTSLVVTQPAVSVGRVNHRFTTTTHLDPRRGQPTKVTDPNGQATTLAYDPLGRLTDVTYPGNTTGHPSVRYSYTLAYKAPSRIWTRTLRKVGTEGGATYDSSYTFTDGWGRTVETQIPTTKDNPTNPYQRIVAVTGYDDQGLVRYSVPALANSNNTGTPYDTVVNPDISGAGVPRWTQTTYDAAGRPTQSMDKTGTAQVATTNYSYTGATTTIDPPGPSGDRRSTLDPWGRALTTAVYNGSFTGGGTPTIVDKVDYSTDPLGRLTTAVKAIGGATKTWTWHYDWAGRQVSSGDPDTGATTTTYDDNNNPTLTHTPLGDVTTSYDALDRPTARTFGTDTTPITTWTYDSATHGYGRPATTTTRTPSPGVATGYDTYQKRVTGYDPAGRPLSVDEGLSSGFFGGTATDTTWRTSTYTYLAGGLLSTASYDAVTQDTTTILPATTLTYTYGNNASLDKIKTGKVIAADTTYNNIGERINLDSTNGATTPLAMTRTYTYDIGTGRRLTEQADSTGTTAPGTATALLRQEYTYDKAGNPTRINHRQQLGTSASTYTASCYTYDPAARLKTAVVATVAAITDLCPADLTGVRSSLTYDYGTASTAGDRLLSVTSALDGLTRTYNYAGTGPHQFTSITGNGTGSDPALPAKGTLTWRTDGSGRAARWAPTTSRRNATSVDYSYDTAGRLLATAPSSGATGSTVRNLYDADGNRVARATTDPTGATATTLYFDDVEIETTKPATGNYSATAARRVITTPDGTPVAFQRSNGSGSSGWTWLFADRQNSIRQAVTTSAALSHNYTPYGAPVTNTTTTDQPGTSGNRGYLNRPHDPTGDIRLDQRTYHPTTATFTAPDPLLDTGSPQSYNPYAYGAYNPVTNADPSGLAPSCVLQGTCQHTANPHGGPPTPATPVHGYNPDGTSTTTGTVTPYQAQRQAITDQIVRHYEDPVHNPLPQGYGHTNAPHINWWAVAGWSAAIIGLTVLNIAQAGADPITDTAEVGAGTALVAELEGEAIATELGAAETAPEAESLFRGVPHGHPGYEDAGNGIARPWGGHADPALHNGGNTQSVFTSWTTDKSIAREVASEGNGPGIVLRIPNADGPGYTRVASPDVYDEAEVLIRGIVNDAEVLPWRSWP